MGVYAIGCIKTTVTRPDATSDTGASVLVTW